MLNQITPVILTYNEQANIERTLSALDWAPRIVVLDSFSDDATEEICRRHNNVDFRQRRFDQHAQQWNYALQLDIGTEWTMTLDADHVVSPQLCKELADLSPPDHINGYWVGFEYWINGKRLRQSLYPPLISLHRTGTGEFQQDGHTQRIKLQGATGELNAKMIHDDRKSWSRWLQSQRNYADQEAQKLAQQRWSELAAADRIRKLGIAPIVVLPFTLLIKGTLFSGWPGMIYAAQRFIAELYLQRARVKHALGF
ncbi:MAG: glycosyltransferase family 2 protein [Gammaproteobacteria bacterium]|nr:glycosyltransferase family 2 protein [Gammaproteobacteria bacterium]